VISPRDFGKCIVVFFLALLQHAFFSYMFCSCEFSGYENQAKRKISYVQKQINLLEIMAITS